MRCMTTNDFVATVKYTDLVHNPVSIILLKPIQNWLSNPT